MVSRHAPDAPCASSQTGEHATAASLKLSSLDLNLLLVFDALYVERSATRAGQRLNLSQSAVSHALSRLRERIGDDLFVKGPEGMTPTLRARSVAPRVQAALAALKTALGDTAFDPSTSQQRFVIAADPYARAVLLPFVIGRLRELAPQADVRIKPGVAGLADALDNGDIDLAIAGYSRVPERFGAVDLLEDRLVWALRAGHPAAAEPLTLERLADLPLLTRLNPSDDNGDDGLPSVGRGLVRRGMQDDDGALVRALASIGRRHTTRVTVPDTYSALITVSESDLAALVPARKARPLADHFGLRLFEPPYPSPVNHLSMIWDQGYGANAAAEWLRQQIIETAASLGPG